MPTLCEIRPRDERRNGIEAIRAESSGLFVLRLGALRSGRFGPRLNEERRFVNMRIDENMVEQARNTDLIAYLTKRYGFTFAQQGGAFRCHQHQSFAITRPCTTVFDLDVRSCGYRTQANSHCRSNNARQSALLKTELGQIYCNRRGNPQKIDRPTITKILSEPFLPAENIRPVSTTHINILIGTFCSKMAYSYASQ